MQINHEVVEKAREFAVQAHAGQMYGKSQYSKHLADVAGVASRFDCPDIVVAAAWLHDVIEDTPVDAGLLEETFGGELTKLVLAVTDEPGKNRRDRHRLTYPKTRTAGANAVALKLCDRIANVEAAFSDGNAGKLSMYRNEHHDFTAALFLDGENADLWGYLDNLMMGTVTPAGAGRFKS